MKTQALEEGMKSALRERTTLRKVKAAAMLMTVALLFSSCYKEPWYGHDGHPGRAQLSLAWIDDKPDYVNSGTPAIPEYFQWDRYYPANPGFYTMYYDGSLWNGYNWTYYAWEIDFEIWRASGEPGGLYYHGSDGPDTYFTIECSPYGPYLYEDMKITPVNPGYEVLQESEDEISILKSDKDFRMKITYRKVDRRIQK